ncbi:hypothetical protein PRIPAC_71650, partial [Pristionchus pacificus]|uniref:Uncharacterized protein n=1 Tax=Pristionchus pacificus TaxID=54126 RepID=A0A2A6B4Z0_PRIPA
LISACLYKPSRSLPAFILFRVFSRRCRQFYYACPCQPRIPWFRHEMQPLRAFLLPLVISMTLFHLVDSTLPAGVTDATNAVGDAGTKAVAGASGVANDASKAGGAVITDVNKGAGDIKDGASKAGNDIKNGAEGVAKDISNTCFNGVGPGCPAAAISSLLSLAVVMLVALFSRQ